MDIADNNTTMLRQKAANHGRFMHSPSKGEVLIDSLVGLRAKGR